MILVDSAQYGFMWSSFIAQIQTVTFQPPVAGQLFPWFLILADGGPVLGPTAVP